MLWLEMCHLKEKSTSVTIGGIPREGGYSLGRGALQHGGQVWPRDGIVTVSKEALGIARQEAVFCTPATAFSAEMV